MRMLDLTTTNGSRPLILSHNDQFFLMQPSWSHSPPSQWLPPFISKSIFLSRNAKHALAASALVVLTLLLVMFRPHAPSFRSLAFLGFASPSIRNNTEVTIICEYSDGKWVKDKAHPLGARSYTEDCPFLDPGFQCMRNGRNDSSFLHWHWQPHGCHLPTFNATEMLERSRNGRIVFAGDSIGRNQWESLVCMLAAAVSNQSNIYERSGKPISKHRGYLCIVFADYNLSVEYYRAPMLVMVDRLPANAAINGLKGAIRLDVLPRHANRWAGADVLILNTGHWWNQDKTIKAGNYFKLGNDLNLTMDIKEAFQRCLQTVKVWALSNPRLSESYLYFRSYSPSHYSNGTWDIGGSCANQHDPVASDSKFGQEPWSNLMISEMMEEMKSYGRNVQFLNITYMTELRKDGHPSGHREPGTPPDAPEDCSHWCLPGVPDTWNEIMYAHLLSMGYDRRRNNI